MALRLIARDDDRIDFTTTTFKIAIFGIRMDSMLI